MICRMQTRMHSTSRYHLIHAENKKHTLQYKIKCLKLFHTLQYFEHYRQSLTQETKIEVLCLDFPSFYIGWNKS